MLEYTKLVGLSAIQLRDGFFNENGHPISKGNDVLLGMDFLRKFNKKLYLDCAGDVVKLE